MPQRHRSPVRRRVGLALAGGGPVGAMYELGALRALEEAVDGLDLNDVWSYVGVSAGSFIAACLANGITTEQMLTSVLGGASDVAFFQPEVFFMPAYREFAERGVKLPKLVWEAVWHVGRRPGRQGVAQAINVLTRALPVGVFNNEPIRRYLHGLFTTHGRTDDFRELRHRLTVVASDLDAGSAITFGVPGLDDVPISVAVQASTAVPGVYPPVTIGKRRCVDGVLLKTVHASVALQQGAELLFCVNPIVPVDVSAAVRSGHLPEDVLVEAGLPAVLSQTFRTMIHSRLRIGLARYASRFPNADLVLLEPGADEYEMFFSNVFSFRSRRAICERGYESTRRDLLDRYDEIAPIVAAHGLELRLDVLEDTHRSLAPVAGVDRGPRVKADRVMKALDHTLTRLEQRMTK